MTDLDEAAFQALYGTWAPLHPQELAHLMGGAGFPWWVVGGWALELATTRARPHDDLDVSVRRQDLAALAGHLNDWHLWAAQDGALKPLVGYGSWPDDHEQLWMRKNAQSPWVLDWLLTPTEASATGDVWIFKKDPRIRLPLTVAVRPGPIPYLAPHVVLLHKAHLCRPKDDADLDATLPLLDKHEVEWLVDAMQVAVPGSPWLSRLG